HGHGHAEALPRPGIAILGGLLCYFFLLAPIGHLFGIDVGGHGHEPAHVNQTTLWALRAGVFTAGCIVGWFVAFLVNRLLGAFFGGFNWTFDRAINGYGFAVRLILRLSAIALLVYVGLLALTYVGFKTVPVGFIPQQDKGYLVLNAQLPEGATLD